MKKNHVILNQDLVIKHYGSDMLLKKGYAFKIIAPHPKGYTVKLGSGVLKHSEFVIPKEYYLNKVEEPIMDTVVKKLPPFHTGQLVEVTTDIQFTNPSILKGSVIPIDSLSETGAYFLYNFTPFHLRYEWFKPVAGGTKDKWLTQKTSPTVSAKVPSREDWLQHRFDSLHNHIKYNVEHSLPTKPEFSSEYVSLLEEIYGGGV